MKKDDETYDEIVKKLRNTRDPDEVARLIRKKLAKQKEMKRQLSSKSRKSWKTPIVK